MTILSEFSGVLFFLILTAIPMTWLASLIVRPLYRRAIARHMRAQAGLAAPDVAIPPARENEDRRLVLDTTRADAATPLRWALALRYTLAGLAHGATTTAIAVAVGEIDARWLQILALFTCYTLPVIALGLHVLGLPVLAGVAATALAVGMLMLLEPDMWMVALWIAGLPALAGLLLANRWYRSTSLVLFAVSMATVFGWLLGLDLVTLASGSFDYLGVIGVLILTLFLGPLAGLVAALALGYLLPRSSDYMLQSDAIWMFVTLWQVLLFSTTLGSAAVVVALSFVVYRAVLWLASRATRPHGPARTLLFLRVFGNRSRQERNAATLLTAWRHTGPVTLIGAADLATETLDPPELAAFFSLRLGTLFLRTERDMARLTEVSPPFADGLHPMRDYYCVETVWRAAVQVLMSQADEIVLDARDFTEANLGVTFEIEQMLRRADPAHIRVLFNEGTDTDLLHRLIDEAWAGFSTCARDGDPAVLHVVETT